MSEENDTQRTIHDCLGPLAFMPNEPTRDQTVPIILYVRKERTLMMCTHTTTLNFIHKKETQIYAVSQRLQMGKTL